MFFHWYYKNPDFEQESASNRDLNRCVLKGVRAAWLPWGKPVAVVLVHHTLDGQYTHSTKQNITQAQIDAAAPFAQYQHPPLRYSWPFIKAHPTAAAALKQHVPA